MTRPFDATLLARDESDAIATAIQILDDMDSNRLGGSILLGAIPVLDGDGMEVLGYLKQGDDWQWRFLTPSTFDPSEALPPPPRRSHPDQYDPEGDDCA